jgi:hypothetical protein
LASSKCFFSQGATIIFKDRNRLSKETFEYIIALKSWGLFKEEEEEIISNIISEDFNFKVN